MLINNICEYCLSCVPFSLQTVNDMAQKLSEIISMKNAFKIQMLIHFKFNYVQLLITEFLEFKLRFTIHRFYKFIMICIGVRT